MDPADCQEPSNDANQLATARIFNQPLPSARDRKQKIWAAVCEFIGEQLRASKGVTISGFGTFGICQLKYDVGTRVLIVQRPVFQAAERFLQTLGIQQSKCNAVSGEIPLVLLNYSQLAIVTSIPRSEVETSVREILQILSRDIAANGAVEQAYPGIGKLIVSHGKLKMRFYKEFVSSLDSSGRAVSVMRNRPHTSDSVMSRAESATPNLTPRETSLVSSCKPERQPMQTIEETIDERDCCNEESSQCVVSEVTNEYEASRQEGEQGPADNGERVASKTMEERETIFNELPRARSPDRSLSARPRTNASATSVVSRSLSALPPFANQNIHPLDTLPDLANRPKTALTNSTTSASRSGNEENQGQNECCHSNRSRQGKGLCYLCYQREKRNVPVSFEEEIRKRDAEEERMLDAYHQMDVSAHLLKQRERALQKRLESQHDAAFNLGVADALRTERAKRPFLDKFQPSFLFNRRARTPPRSIKQKQLRSVLRDQIDSKTVSLNRHAEEEFFLDKLELVHNAEELARYRAEYERQRAERVKHYKEALDAQEQYKDGLNQTEDAIRKEIEAQTRPIFIDSKAIDAAQQARETRSKAVAEILREDALRKKQQELADRMQKQTEEADMLKRVAEELTYDRAERHIRHVKTTEELEREWRTASEDKALRDFEEMRDMLRNPPGLLQEQLEKYKRCNQCKRKTINCGESHVYTDTRYTNGSRYMV